MAEDLTGKRFGRWTVLRRDVSRVPTNKRNDTYWICRCDCGVEKSVRHSSLTSGNSKSCGCYHSECSAKAHTIHSGYYDRLYGVWNGMRQRCNNPNNHKYPLYGARGITVCDDWNSYERFREWAVKSGYNPSAGYGECTLDRIDVNKGYCPENCRWVSDKEQANNKRNNHVVLYNNTYYTISELSESVGIPYGVISQRLWRGWSVVRAVETPVRK